MTKTNPLKVSDIERLANFFRKEYNISKDKYFPILEVLDDLMVNGLVDYQIVEDDYFEDAIKAQYNCSENCIYIKESVLEEYDNKVFRSNFTLAHEFFHYVQNKILEFDFIEVDECKAYEDVEWQADEFAAQLLIPTEYVMCDEEFLINTFHVSIECVLVRKKKYKQRNEKRA